MKNGRLPAKRVATANPVDARQRPKVTVPHAVHVEIDEPRATALDVRGSRARKGQGMVAGLVVAPLAMTPTAGPAAEVHAELSVQDRGAMAPRAVRIPKRCSIGSMRTATAS